MSYRFAVCTVQNSWWWTEELSETCRVLFQKQIWEISAYSWFYYKNVKVCVLWVWLKYVNFKLKIEELYGGIQILSVRQSKRWYRTWNQATTDSFHILSIQIFTIHSINWLRSLPVINSNSKWSLNKQTDNCILSPEEFFKSLSPPALLEIQDGLIAFSKLRFITNFVVRIDSFPFTTFPSLSHYTR